MSDVTDEQIERMKQSFAETGFDWPNDDRLRAALEAALSGTREAVEPVGHATPEDYDDLLTGGSAIVSKFKQAPAHYRPLYAAPPSDPVGQGAVTVGEPMSLVECPVGLFLSGSELCLKTEYGNNEGRIDAYIVSSGEFFWGSSPQSIENQRKQCVLPVELALSPAPEAVSDEVERLLAERERLALAICGGEDAPGYANAQTVETLERVARESHSIHMQTLDEATALRDQLAAVREALDLDRAVYEAAHKWCGQKDRETFNDDILYFSNNWSALNGLRAYVEKEITSRVLALRATLANTDKEAGR